MQFGSPGVVAWIRVQKASTENLDSSAVEEELGPGYMDFNMNRDSSSGRRHS